LGPGQQGNGSARVPLDQDPERFDANFEPRNESVVEPAKTDEGGEGALTLRERPAVDKRVFRSGGKVPIGAEINSHKFKARVKERALLKLQGNAEFRTDLENNFEERKDGRYRIGPNEGVVDNLI